MTHLPQIPLLPKPRSIQSTDGVFPLKVDSDTLKPTQTLLDQPGLPAQSYRLSMTPQGTRLEAADAAGAFYGGMTLRQLARACGDAIPCGVIEDSPDVPVRGVMLDISRDKVPTMDTLFMLVDMLAEWKINHLQLYMEHTFAYSGHREVWETASPITPEQVRALDAYCRERFIELTPNQNSFGHFERWLKHPRYRSLAECPEGFEAPSGEWRNVPTTLDPTNPDTLALIRELYAELLPTFESGKLHIGCDETWELGKGMSKPQVDARGLHAVFLDYLQQLKVLAAEHDRTSLYWGDMVWNHFPEQLDSLDREMIHVDWGYYRDYPYDEHCAKLAAAKIPFWVAPGTGVWSTLIGCNEAAFGSNRSAAQAAVRYGAKGSLNTDWGDGGHWQHLPVSFIGFAAGAAMAWCEAANSDEVIRNALSPHVFRDIAGVMGEAAHSLADTWQLVGKETTQANLLDRILRGGLTHRLPDNVTEETLQQTDAHIASAVARLSETRMQRPDAQLIVDEFKNNARMARHACRLGIAIRRGNTSEIGLRKQLAADMREIMVERRRLWLVRNRAGGLDDSLRPLENTRRETKQ